MKSRKRLQLALNAATDQVPFDYALMSNLYVHSDGNDVLDFGGCTQKESKRVVQDLLVNESFATSNGTAAGQRPTTLLHIQVDPEDRSPMAPTHAADPPPPTSHLVSMEDSSTHIWIMTQPDEEHAPCARMFHSVVALKKFIQRRNLILPEPMEESESDSSSSSSSESPRLDATRGLPLAHWIDIQADSSCGRFSSIVSEVLAMFPLDTETVDRCTYLGGYDVIDTNHLTADAGSYVFVNLLCTPIISSTSVEPFDEGSEVGSSTASNAPINGNKKSVMEMRFDAMRKGKPTKSIPEPVAVAIIMFRDWMVTIHERAFAEFDDLLRLVQARCAPVATAPSPVQRGTGKLFSVLDSSYVEHLRFTTASIFVMLIQIAVGHNLDTVQLAGVVDELGDAIFELPDCTKPMEDDVIETITTIRRCFGECGAEVTRRENIVTTLLQPHLSSNFLMKDAYLRQQLLNVQAHLLRVQHELADCRDTVAMSNWHHNVVLQYSLLRRNNRTVRMVLLLSEMANIMYPVMMIQTLYAMNLKDPYEADVEPPLTSLGPYFIIAGCICAYLLLCARPLAAMIRRRPFETRLLA